MRDTDQVGIRIPSWLYDEIEQKAVDLLVSLQVCKLPIDPLLIIRKMGIEVVPFSKLSSDVDWKEDEGNDAFSFFSKEENKFYITYNDKAIETRIRFSLMHEVGHIVLGHKGESFLASKIADYFAGYILAPYPLILEFTGFDRERVMRTFGISRGCADVTLSRCCNWDQYSGPMKDYERKLIHQFKRK